MTMWRLSEPDTLVVGLFSDSAVCYHRETRVLNALSLAAGQLLVRLQQLGTPIGLKQLASDVMDGESSPEDVALVESCLLQLAALEWVQQVQEGDLQHAVG
jgi:hypothetical protein